MNGRRPLPHPHRRRAVLLPVLLLAWLAGGRASAADGTVVPVLFVHHSVGRYLLQEGNVRQDLADLGRQHGVQVQLWDHDYNQIGLSDPDGRLTGISYHIPGDNTDPDGWDTVWTTPSSCRDSLLGRYRVVVFKSCFSASAIASDAELAADYAHYRHMAAEFDHHPDRLFVVVTPPPRHPLATDPAAAARARALADWLVSAAFLAGHDNVKVFDLFDRLAAPDDGAPGANMLRPEYQRSTTDPDSHPNRSANQAVGPDFAAFLADAAATTVTAASCSWGTVKQRYR